MDVNEQPANIATDMMLVDRPFPNSVLKKPQNVARRPQFRFPATSMARGIVLPQFFDGTALSLFESLTRFMRHRWHMDILCGQTHLEPDHQHGSRVRSEPDSSRRGHATIRAPPFLYLLSSSLWETNFRYLESEIKRISLKAFEI